MLKAQLSLSIDRIALKCKNSCAVVKLWPSQCSICYAYTLSPGLKKMASLFKFWKLKTHAVTYWSPVLRKSSRAQPPAMWKLSLNSLRTWLHGDQTCTIFTQLAAILLKVVRDWLDAMTMLSRPMCPWTFYLGSGVACMYNTSFWRHVSWGIILLDETSIGWYIVKKRLSILFPVPSRDVTDQTLPDRGKLNYSRPGRV